MLFWLIAISVYLVFLDWYYNWSGPIKSHEIDTLWRSFLKARIFSYGYQYRSSVFRRG